MTEALRGRGRSMKVRVGSRAALLAVVIVFVVGVPSASDEHGDSATVEELHRREQEVSPRE
jgi:hypothetical protein